MGQLVLRGAERVIPYCRQFSIPPLEIGSCFTSQTVRRFPAFPGKAPDPSGLLLVIDTVNSSTSYVYDTRSRTYHQPTYAAQTLQNFLAVNSQLLQRLKTPEDIPIEGRATIQKGTPLTELIAAGAKDQGSAPAVLSTLMGILGKQTEYVAPCVGFGRLRKLPQIPSVTCDRRLPGALFQNIVQRPSILRDQILSPLYAPVAPGIRQREKIIRAFYLDCSVPPDLTRLNRRGGPSLGRCRPRTPHSVPQ